jgi:hypothetical protein
LQLIVGIDKGRSGHGYSHHAKLISKSLLLLDFVLIATNLAPKTEVSMVACFLETLANKAILQKIDRNCDVLP